MGKKVLKGLGGWLWVPAINLIFNILGMIIFYFQFGIPGDFWTLVDLFFFSYTIHVTILFFTKDSRVPQRMTLWYIMIIIYQVSLFIDMGDIFGPTLIRSIILASIWIPYFHQSIRVKNTFIERVDLQEFFGDINK